MLNSPSTTRKTTVAAGVPTRKGCDPNSVRRKIKIGAGTATSGTVTLTVVSAGDLDSEAETVNYNGVPIVFDAASSASQSFEWSGVFDAVILTPSALNGTYTYIYSEW